MVIPQLPKRRGVVQRLKKTPLIRWLYDLYHSIKFYAGFEKFSYENEFRGYVCKLPFEYAEITNSGDLSACCYLPRNFGNAYKNSFRKAWNSYFAKQVRKSILDGSFCYCDKTRCRSMQNLNANLIKIDEVQDDRLKNIIQNSAVNLNFDVKTLSLGMDYTCNLKCPSCRTGMRKMGEDEVSYQLANFNSILEEIGSKLELIHIAGDGDPFASKVYHTILFKTNWTQYPNLKIGIQTNGIALSERTWHGLPPAVKSKISYIGISIDGASAAIYEKLRLGGNFDKLIRNIEYLAKMPDRKTYHISLNLNMIVQAENYKEMIPLIELGRRIGVDKVGFTYMYNWGTFMQNEYEKKAVHLRNHPEHSNLLVILNDSIFNDPSIDVGNLAYLINDHAPIPEYEPGKR
jgi:MoaA/NifB/PqqE/SkfB family radical SAM enzyme